MRGTILQRQRIAATRRAREQGGWTSGHGWSPSANVQRDAASITSGTLATLTGFNRLADLDRVQGQFVQFVQGKEGQYRNWIQAWHDFDAIHSSEWPNPKPVAAALRQMQGRARRARESSPPALKFNVGDVVIVWGTSGPFSVQRMEHDDYAGVWKYQINGRWYNESGVEKYVAGGPTVLPINLGASLIHHRTRAAEDKKDVKVDQFAKQFKLSDDKVEKFKAWLEEKGEDVDSSQPFGKWMGLYQKFGAKDKKKEEARRAREQGWTYTRHQVDYKGHRIEWMGQSVMIYDNNRAVWEFSQSGDAAQDEVDAKAWIDQRLAGRASRRTRAALQPGERVIVQDIPHIFVAQQGDQLYFQSLDSTPHKKAGDEFAWNFAIHISKAPLYMNPEDAARALASRRPVREQGDPEPSGTIAPISPELERGDPAVIELPPDAAALPEEAQVLWLETYVSYLDGGEEPAVHQAWTAVYDAGWSQDDTGQWHRGEIVAPVVDDATGGVEDIVMMPEARRHTREAAMTPQEWATRVMAFSPDIKQAFLAWMKAERGISADQVVVLDDLPWYWAEFQRTANLLTSRESQITFGPGVVKYQTTLATVLQMTDDVVGKATAIGRAEWFNIAEAENFAKQQSMVYPAPQRFLVYDGDGNLVSVWQGGVKMSMFTVATRRAREAQENDVRPLTPQEMAAFPGMASTNVALFKQGQWVYADGPLNIPEEVMPITDEGGYYISVRESVHQRLAARRPARETGTTGFEAWREQVQQIALRQGVSPAEIARKLSEQELVFWSWYDRDETPEAAATELMPTLHARRVPVREKKTHTTAWHRCVDEIKRSGGGKYNPYAVCTWSIDRPGGEEVYKGSRRAHESLSWHQEGGEHVASTRQGGEARVYPVTGGGYGADIYDASKMLIDNSPRTFPTLLVAKRWAEKRLGESRRRTHEAVLTLTLEDARKADDILAEEMERAGVQALQIDTDTWEITEVPAGETPVKEPPAEEEKPKEARRDWVRPTSRRPVREREAGTGAQLFMLFFGETKSRLEVAEMGIAAIEKWVTDMRWAAGRDGIEMANREIANAIWDYVQGASGMAARRPMREAAGMTIDEFFADDPDRDLIQQPFEEWLLDSGRHEKGASLTEEEWASLLTDYEEQVGQEGMAARRAREQNEGEEEEPAPKEIALQAFADEKDIGEDDLAKFKKWLADNEKEAGSQPVEDWQKLYDQFGKAGGEEEGETAESTSLTALEAATRQAIREESAYLAETVDRRLVTGMGGFSDRGVRGEITDEEMKDAFRGLLPDLDDDQLESVVNGRD